MRNKGLLLTSFFLLFLFIAADGLFAQKAGGGGKAPPGPAQPPPKSPPSGMPPKAQGSPKTQKPTLKDLDEKRIRVRDKHEKAKQNTSSTGNTPAPNVPSTPPGLEIEPNEKGDVRIASTSWRIEARKGKRPFTVLTIKVANNTDRFISVRDFRVEGRNLAVLDPMDTRPLPPMPLVLKRFSDVNRIPAPMGPRGRQTLTFALPFALKSTADLKARVGRYVKFKVRNPLDWEPVNVVRWETGQTISKGRNHQGLFLVVENKAAYPVKARLKVTLDDLESAGGGSLFFHQVALDPKERKTVMVRTIPDEGCLPGDPRREMYPEIFKVKNVGIADLQF